MNNFKDSGINIDSEMFLAKLQPQLGSISYRPRLVNPPNRNVSLNIGRESLNSFSRNKYFLVLYFRQYTFILKLFHFLCYISFTFRHYISYTLLIYKYLIYLELNKCTGRYRKITLFFTHESFICIFNMFFFSQSYFFIIIHH